MSTGSVRFSWANSIAIEIIENDNGKWKWEDGVMVLTLNWFMVVVSVFWVALAAWNSWHN